MNVKWKGTALLTLPYRPSQAGKSVHLQSFSFSSDSGARWRAQDVALTTHDMRHSQLSVVPVIVQICSASFGLDEMVRTKLQLLLTGSRGCDHGRDGNRGIRDMILRPKICRYRVFVCFCARQGRPCGSLWRFEKAEIGWGDDSYIRANLHSLI